VGALLVLLVLNLSPKGLASDTRIPMPGTPAMRSLRKTLERYCRRHPSTACTELVHELESDEAALRVSIDVSDHLRVFDDRDYDAFPATFFEWKNGKWVVYKVGMVWAGSPIPFGPL
jgi:hypothetical protein